MRTLSQIALGLLMVVSVAIGSHGVALVLVAFAVLAVGAGAVSGSAATMAVILTIGVTVASDPPHVLTGLSGLCAVGYLMSRHLAESWTSLIAAIGFSFVGLVATSFPLQVPWLPLLAPLGVLALYVAATRPFLN